VEQLGRRLLLAQVVEVARAVEEGVILRPRDAEVGAIFGIGFAPNTGGPLAWMDRQGAAALVAELEGLSATAGERFAPPSLLRGMAASGERFFTT
jgi:3-hydroxyacyl-CoA dehydrogenase/enoyl-CoA hydratase/3-hydroxybutyryl-CoA epimerase